MKLQAFKYYLKQGFKGVSQNRLMSIASIGTSVATLFILGVFIALSTNANYFTEQISRDCEMQVFIHEDATEEEYQAIGEQIKNISGVLGVEPYTKEQIFEEMRTKLKDKESILDGLEQDNPFRDSFKVTLTDLNATQAVYDQVNAIEGVANITAFQEVAGILTNVTRTVKNVSFWVVIILCIIAAFIISNTIKLSVFARRKEINIMKYIGATDWFIRWPFVIEGILIGLYGAIISFVLIWIVYDRIYASIQIGYFELLPFSAIMWVIIGAFVAVGTVIGAVGSIISIRKHLKV